MIKYHYRVRKQIYGLKWNTLVEFLIHLLSKLLISFENRPVFPVKPSGKPYSWKEIKKLHESLRIANSWTNSFIRNQNWR